MIPMDEQEIVVDEYRSGPHRSVKLTHLPTGVTAESTSGSMPVAHAAAYRLLRQRFAERGVASVILARFPDTPWSRALIAEIAEAVSRTNK